MIHYPPHRSERRLRTAMAGAGLELEVLLRALAEVETAGGVWPRLEPAFMPAGRVAWVQGRRLRGTGRAWNPIVAERWQRWGLASAASYGPWQMLYHTAADAGFTDAPWLLMLPDVARWWTLDHLDRLWFDRGARTLRDLADAWNSGTHRDGIVPQDYIARVERAYYTGG